MRPLYALIISFIATTPAFAAHPDIQLAVTPLSQTITHDHKPMVTITISNHGDIGVWSSRDVNNYMTCQYCAQYAALLKIHDENGQWPELTHEGEMLLSHKNPGETRESLAQIRAFIGNSWGYLLEPHMSDTVAFPVSDLCVLVPGHTYYLSFGRNVHVHDAKDTKLYVQSNTVSITVR